MSPRFRIVLFLVSFCVNLSLAISGRLLQLSTNEGITAYKYGRECYIQQATDLQTQAPLIARSNLTGEEQDTVLFVSPDGLSIDALLMFGSADLVKFCSKKEAKIVWKGNPAPVIQQLLGQYNHSTVRHKRSTIYRKTRTTRRGQSQSQYVGFKGAQGNNRAIATSDKRGARTEVGGGHGMGQAQSQYSGDCGDIGGCSGSGGDTSQGHAIPGSSTFRTGIGGDHIGRSYPVGQATPQIGGIAGWPRVENIPQSIYPSQGYNGFRPGMNGQQLGPDISLGLPQQGFTASPRQISPGSMGVAFSSRKTFPQVGQGPQVMQPSQYAPSYQSRGDPATPNYKSQQDVSPHLRRPPAGHSYGSGGSPQFAGQRNQPIGSRGVMHRVQPSSAVFSSNHMPLLPVNRIPTSDQSRAGHTQLNGVIQPESGHVSSSGIPQIYPDGTAAIPSSVGFNYLPSQGTGYIRGISSVSPDAYQPPGNTFPRGHDYSGRTQGIGMPSRVATGSTSNLSNGKLRPVAKNGGSQSETQLTIGYENVAASSGGHSHFAGGSSQSQVQGSYTGTGTISAQAQGGSEGRISQSQIIGTNDGAMGSSSSQAGSMGQSQTQVQIGYPSGLSAAEAQSLYGNGLTSSNVQASGEGGQASSQASGLASTSSQAQVGVKENEGSGKFDLGNSKFMGTGMASSQSGSFGGHSQSQIIGKYDEGNHYASSAQAGSGRFIGSHGGLNNLGSLATPLSSGIAPIQDSSGQQQGPSQFSGGNVHALTPQLTLDGQASPDQAVANGQLPAYSPNVHQQGSLPGYQDQVPQRPTGPLPSKTPLNGQELTQYVANIPGSVGHPQLTKVISPIVAPTDQGLSGSAMHFPVSQDTVPSSNGLSGKDSVISDSQSLPGAYHRPGSISGQSNGRTPLIEWPGPSPSGSIYPRPSGYLPSGYPSPAGPPGSQLPGFPSPRQHGFQQHSVSSPREKVPYAIPDQGQPLPIGHVIRPTYPGADSASTVSNTIQPSYGKLPETGGRKGRIGNDASDATGSVYASAPGGQSQSQGIFIGGDKIRDGTEIKVVKSSQPLYRGDGVDHLSLGQYPFIPGVTGLETQKETQNVDQPVTFSGPVLNPGDAIPGFPGQRIPNGFRGHVYPSGQRPFKTTSQHAVNGFKAHIATQPGSSEDPILAKIDGSRTGITHGPGGTKPSLHVSMAKPGKTQYYPQGPGATHDAPGLQVGMPQRIPHPQGPGNGNGKQVISHSASANGKQAIHHRASTNGNQAASHRTSVNGKQAIPHRASTNGNQAAIRNGIDNGKNGNKETTLLKGSNGNSRRNGKNGKGPHVSHTYYSKESPCGYFSFSCNIVFKSRNKVKICKPLPVDVVCCC